MESLHILRKLILSIPFDCQTWGQGWRINYLTKKLRKLETSIITPSTRLVSPVIKYCPLVAFWWRYYAFCFCFNIYFTYLSYTQLLFKGDKVWSYLYRWAVFFHVDIRFWQSKWILYGITDVIQCPLFNFVLGVVQWIYRCHFGVDDVV